MPDANTTPGTLAASTAATADAHERAPHPSDLTILVANLTHDLSLLHQAVHLLEPRFTTRALRSLPELRKKLGAKGEVLAEAIRSANIYKDGQSLSPRRDERRDELQRSERKSTLIDILGNPPPPPRDAPAPASAESATMDVDLSPAEAKEDAVVQPKKKKQEEELKEVASNLPEGDAFVALLVVVSLLDQGEYDKPGWYVTVLMTLFVHQGKQLATSLIEQFSALNRRTLDQLMSKLYFYWVRLHELSGDDVAALRPTLLAAQRTAALRHDDDLQATLLPLLLRNYLDHGLYEQADRLVSKTTFPEATAQNSQLARWYYYVGRIRAIQLDYTSSHASLLQAIRRAPSDLKAAPGFFQHAYKLSVVVELLMGEIPERRIFREQVLRKALRPYLEIAQAVRAGDIQAFNTALTSHSATFTADRTLSLVHRLRHNVIKTALRTISLAYSRISLADISRKLALDSEEDAEYIVAKAIRDGVVVAKVDHEKGEMTSREAGDVYSTGEPMREFDRRIGFLLELRNQSVKAMRYPLNVHSKELASAEEARERERELAKEIEDGDDDADLDGPGDLDSF
ncbi:SPOSA6832_04229, partial [Sporobolomyces salmonicolor]